MENNEKKTPKKSDDRSPAKKKLALRKHSIRQLDDQALAIAVGGVEPDRITCSKHGHKED